ncbi:MAG: hypothetical protein WBA63_17970 [Thermomicrobiales bacterium]
MADPNEPAILSDEEIERRLAELEASIADESPKPAPRAAGSAAPEADADPLAPSRPASTRRSDASDSQAIVTVPEPTQREKKTASASYGQTIGTSRIVERAIGIARFSQPYYRDVAGDPGATLEAALVVVVVAAATGLGGITAGFGGFFAGVVWAVIRWLLFTAAAWFLAREFFKTQPEGTIGGLSRVLGYAQAPGLLAIVGFIPLLGWSLAAVGNIWLVLTVVVALRYVLKLSFGQSFLTAIGAWIAAGILAALLAFVLGVNLSVIF